MSDTRSLWQELKTQRAEFKHAIQKSPADTESLLRKAREQSLTTFKAIMGKPGDTYELPVKHMSELINSLSTHTSFYKKPIRDGVVAYLRSMPLPVPAINERTDKPAGNTRLHGLGILMLACNRGDSELAATVITAFNCTDAAKGRGFQAGIANSAGSIADIAAIAGFQTKAQQEALYVDQMRYIFANRKTDEVVALLAGLDPEMRLAALKHSLLAWDLAHIETTENEDGSKFRKQSAQHAQIICREFPNEWEAHLLDAYGDLNATLRYELWRTSQAQGSAGPHVANKTRLFAETMARVSSSDPALYRRCAKKYVTSLLALQKNFQKDRGKQYSLPAIIKLIESAFPEAVSLAKRYASEHGLHIIEDKPDAIPVLVALLDANAVMSLGISSQKQRSQRAVMDAVVGLEPQP